MIKKIILSILIIFVSSLSYTQTFAKESSDDIDAFFQNKLKATVKIQRDLINFSEDVPEYDLSTYNSVYEVALSVNNVSYLISSIASLGNMINIKYKKHYNNYLMHEIKSIKKQVKINIKRLDQLSASLIRHPGLQRATNNLTEICININNKSIEL